MTTHKGFALTTALIIIISIFVVGGVGYLIFHPELVKAPAQEAKDDGVQTAPGDHPEEDHDATDGMSSNKTSIAWKFEDLGEYDYSTHTRVTVAVNGKSHVVGEYRGSCNEIDASGGMDGKGLLAGELSAVQCFFGGGGDEVGVFANEDGGLEVMVGELGEGEGYGPFFRGNFKIRTDIHL